MKEWAGSTGLPGKPDFVPNNNGLGGFFYPDTEGQIYSIVTGNGFVGNAQRMSHTNINPPAQLSRSYLNIGKKVRITLKYRSNKNIYVGASSMELPVNTGNAISGTVTGDIDYFRIGIKGTPQNGDWIEIDELSIKSGF